MWNAGMEYSINIVRIILDICEVIAFHAQNITGLLVTIDIEGNMYLLLFVFILSLLKVS